MKKFDRTFTIFVILAAFLASMSCAVPGFGGAGTPPTDTPKPSEKTAAANTAVANVQKPTTAALTEPAQNPTQSSSGGALELSGINSNMSSVDSYRMLMSFNVNGKDDKGNPVKKDFAVGSDAIKSKNDTHLIIRGMAEVAGLMSGNIDLYTVDKNSYLYTPATDAAKASCLSFGSDASMLSGTSMNPADMMKDITTDKLIAKGEVMNGIKTDHYSVKSSDMGFGKVTSQSGEVWIAQDGGYAVHYTGKADGTFTIVNTYTGTLTWTYDLKDINKVASIDLPAECAAQLGALADLAVPPNATNVSNLGTMVTFGSPDKPADLVTYFKASLTAKGWKIDSVDDTLPGIVTMAISKTDTKKSIMITADDKTGGSTVIITPGQ